MRTRSVLAGLAAAGFVALFPGAAAPAYAEDGPTPVSVSRAGTSFLTATSIAADQPVSVAAATGDHLYWSFGASAGQIFDVATTVSLPPSAGRHGAQTWIVEVFDGLRRRQACVAGTQSAVAAAADAQVSVRCTLRQVRSWAEPWSGDPLPGTYYLRLSVNDMPEQDLGQVARVELSLTVRDGDLGSDDGELAAPLAPVTKTGSVSTSDTTGTATGGTATGDGATGDEEDEDFLPDMPGLPSLSARWFWTGGGGILAGVAGVVGFALTRRRRSPAAG